MVALPLYLVDFSFFDEARVSKHIKEAPGDAGTNVFDAGLKFVEKEVFEASELLLFNFGTAKEPHEPHVAGSTNCNRCSSSTDSHSCFRIHL